MKKILPVGYFSLSLLSLQISYADTPPIQNTTATTTETNNLLWVDPDGQSAMPKRLYKISTPQTKASPPPKAEKKATNSPTKPVTVQPDQNAQKEKITPFQQLKNKLLSKKPSKTTPAALSKSTSTSAQPIASTASSKPAAPATPAKPATAAVPAQTIAPAAPAQTVAATAPAQATAPTAPAQATAPTAPAQATAPTAPAQATAPTAPAQTTAPTAPAQTTAPAAPAQTTAPAAPAQTTAPAAPAQTTAPAAPAQTTAPAAPAQTIAPAAPAQPTAPAAPAQTIAPAAPAQTTAPAAPAQTVAATAPAQATAPAAPAQTVAATAPAQPTAPTTPAQPVAATAPAQPTTATAPAQPGVSSAPVSIPAPSVLAEAPKIAGPIDCLYHSQAAVSEQELSQWAQYAVMKSFEYSFDKLDDQLQNLKSCFTEQGWIGFHEALQQSGNLSIIKNQQLTVSSQLSGQPMIQTTQKNQWQIIVPIRVVYQNTQEKFTQSLAVTLVVTKKASTELGIVQLIATVKSEKAAAS